MRSHFIGIGGIGMSALARLLHARGDSVSGSDERDGALLADLCCEGIDVSCGHDAKNVGDADRAIFSSAIDHNANPEYVEARRRGIPVLHRGELLAELVRERRGIAISGTHGKTTTTAMVHAVLRAAGIDAGLVLGGIDCAIGSNSHLGRDEWFVAEADESDGSFVLLEPEIAVVTNIENDHLASNAELPRLVDAFAAFVARVPERGCVVVCRDDAHASSLSTRSLRAPVVTFGTSEDATIRATAIEFTPRGARFQASADGADLGRIELAVPGIMNVRNALPAIAIGRRLEIPFVRIADGLQSFRGVRRRFDVLCQGEHMTVIDDYAHHPTAIRETIAAARTFHDGPIVVAFQPHRYTRTAFLAQEFARALRAADLVYLAPVYAASEPPLPGVSASSIGEPLAALGSRVRYVTSVDDLEERLAAEAPAGSLVLMLGAGDITEVASRLARRPQPVQSIA